MTKEIDEGLLEQMRDEYIFGIEDEEKGHRHWPSASELAEKFSVSKSTIYRKSKTWQGDKDRYQQEMQEKRREEIMKNMLKDAERLDSNSIKVAQGSIVAAGNYIRLATEVGIGNQQGQVSPVDFQRVVAAASAAQRIGKLALGEAQFISKVATDVSIPDPLREIIEQLDEIREARSSKAAHRLQ